MLNWTLKPFEKLAVNELYEILQLRQMVFVVEQNCAYLDVDGKDSASHHLMGRNDEGILVAYSRILPAGLAFPEVSIGRIATHTTKRVKGYGKELMAESIRRTEELFGKVPIRIGAQRYLLNFYESFGFVKAGEDYVEDGIEHSMMVRKVI